MEIVYTQDIMERASRGLIKDYYSAEEPTTDKKNLDVVLRTFRAEPIVVSAVRAIADEIVKNGYIIKTSNKQLKNLIEKELKKKYRFKRLLRRLVYNVLIYGNVFIEIVYKDNQPSELHLLETTEMEILADQHGEVRGYVQRHEASEITFTTDECIHISLNNITTGMWGEVDIQTLYKTIALKQFLEKFITNLFRFNKFRDTWSIENADDVQIKDFLNNLNILRDRPEKEMVVEGNVTKIPGRDIKDLNQLVELLNYTRQQILTLLRVPPIIAGIPDNSNRSNSEIQSRKAFDGRIKSIQDVLADEFSWELFPRMGWGSADFEFAPIDKRAEKDDIEIIMALKNIGLDDDSLLKYIQSVGIQLPEGAKIERGTFGGENPFPPSRKPEEKDKSPEHKTGEESTTREEQMIGRDKGYVLDQYAEEVLNKR